MNGNDFVKFFLRTPLRAFMGNTMLITVTGAKTGRTYSTPVSFYQNGGWLWIMSSRDRTWWRNVKNGAPVSVLIHGQTSTAFAEAELDEKAVETHLLDYIQHMPMAARSLKIRMENKKPNPEDIRRVAKDRMFVRVKPKP
jgi:hypothetical protein